MKIGARMAHLANRGRHDDVNQGWPLRGCAGSNETRFCERLRLDRAAETARTRAGARRRRLRAVPGEHGGGASPVYPALARRTARPLRDRGGCHERRPPHRRRRGQEFAIMSVSKPFVFALDCDALGPERERVGHRRQRDWVAVQLPGGDRAERGRPHEPDGQPGRDRHDESRSGDRSRCPLVLVREGLSRFAGRSLTVDEAVYGSASETNTGTGSSPARSTLVTASGATRGRRSTSTPASAA